MAGTGSKKNLDAKFQLIYLTFTAPRADPAAFAVQASQMKTLLANQSASPAYAFSKTLNDVMGCARRSARSWAAPTASLPARAPSEGSDVSSGAQVMVR